MMHGKKDDRLKGKSDMLKREGEVRIPSGCAIAGVFARDGRNICGDTIVR